MMALLRFTGNARRFFPRTKRPRNISAPGAPVRARGLSGTILFLFFLSLNRRFPGFGPGFPSLFPSHARSRLNSFGTLDLKIVGKKHGNK